MMQRFHYTVFFDGKHTHRCESLEEARAFAESNPFEGQKPVKITKTTTTTTTETVYRYDGEAVEQDEAKACGSFTRAFYTVPQAAEELQVHENTIYRLVRSRKVEHYMVGKQIRIAANELEKLKVERGEG